MIAWSYVGEDMDCVVKKLEENYFYSAVGMQNLMDMSLISVDKDNKIVMHHLVRDMAKAIIRKENVDGSGRHNFYNPTRTITETVTSEGSMMSEDVRCGKRKRLDDYDEESMLVNEERSSLFKRVCLGFFSLFEQTTRITKSFRR